MLEPTSGLEPLTCRLRIARFGGTRRNLFQSRIFNMIDVGGRANKAHRGAS